MVKRIDGGHLLVSIGAVVLLVSLFLDWFEPGQSAWTALELVDLLLAVLALAALAGVGIQIGATESAAGPTRAALNLPVIGAVALVLVAYLLIDPPPAAFGRSLELGAWMGLGAAGLMALGSFFRLARVSLVIAPRDAKEAAPQPTREPPPSA